MRTPSAFVQEPINCYDGQMSANHY